jgi:uncharacterized protein (DUF1501 family)
MSIDRRGFLKAAGFGAGAFLLANGLLPRRSLAAPSPDRRFVFCYFSGGWDTLLSLDPRDPDEFTEARMRDTLIQLAWDRLDPQFQVGLQRPVGSNITFGPAIGGFARHHDVSCVVRGLSMDTVSHPVGMRYMLTGKMPRGLQANGSSIPTLIVSQQGEHSSLPNLVSGVETYNDGEPNYATGLSVNGAGDLTLALRPGPDALPATVTAHLQDYRQSASPCDPAALDRHGFLGLIRGATQKARALVEGALYEHFDFGADTPEMREVRDRYGIDDAAVRRAGAKPTPAMQAALASQALRHDIAQCVTIELTGSLDTHDASWSDDQPTNQNAGWEALALLVDDLKSSGLIDRTTLVCFSEFGRTALLNTRDGRDHSLTSSCLLVGAGVPHDKVVGGSSDVGMNPLAIDPQTGAPKPGGTTVTPTLVLASLLEGAGFDATRLRAHGLPVLMPGV